MKGNRCLYVFLTALVITAGLRVFQLLSLTEYETGFILPEHYNKAVIITAFTALIILLSCVFSCACVKGGKKSNVFYLTSSVSAFFTGGMMILQPMGGFLGVPGFLKVLCTVFAVLSAVYFIAFALRSIIHFPFSPYFAVIPAAFFVFKSACSAITGAYHTVISDTVFQITAYCFIMLYFLEFARAANGVTGKKSVKKFAAFGTAAALLSLCFSLPKILISLVSPSSVHDMSLNEYLLFFSGLYIACEVFSRLAFVQKGDDAVSIYYIGKH